MAIIYQHDKRSGITYAYESLSYWDKEKKMSRAKRTLIGRVDTDTGEIVATDGRCKKDKVKKILTRNLITRNFMKSCKRNVQHKKL